MSKMLVLLMGSACVITYTKSLVPMVHAITVMWMDVFHVWLASILSAINVWIAKLLWRMGVVSVLRNNR